LPTGFYTRQLTMGFVYNDNLVSHVDPQGLSGLLLQEKIVRQHHQLEAALVYSQIHNGCASNLSLFDGTATSVVGTCLEFSSK
jgi:hypothetical protein